jgi:hypothetical protein
MLCASVRRKGSVEQCGSRALLGHTLCGTHARSKTVLLWVNANQEKVHAAHRIQALLRGWLVRHRLALAGPGVLRRTELSNDEDLETCESSSRQDPMDYFAFTENGKTWWFDFATLWKWSLMSLDPTNPYTKVPLSVDTKQRLRRMWSARRRSRQPVPQEPSDFQDRLRMRWTVLCQVFADNALGTFNPEPFLRLTKNDYIVVFRILRDELQASLPTTSRLALSLIHRCLISAWTMPPTQFVLQGSYVLMTMLLHATNEPALAFCVLSALYRV